MQNCYVYVHLRLDNNLPFYIGKGKNKRINSKSQRSKHWINHVKKHNGFNSIKIAENLNDELAYLTEMEAIDQYKRIGYKLINKTNGGEGQFGNSVNLNKPKTEQHKLKIKISNTGKRQSTETIQKRIKTFKNVGYKPKNNFGTSKNNCNYRGEYITPNGIFDTLEEVAKQNNISVSIARRNINGKSYKIKGKFYFYPPKDGWSIKLKG